MKKILRFTLPLLALTSATNAQNFIFTADTGDWNQASNWSTFSTPNSTSQVIINGDDSVVEISNSAALANNLILTNNASNIILNVYNDLTVGNNHLMPSAASGTPIVNLYEGNYTLNNIFEIAGRGTAPNSNFNVFGGKLDFSTTTATIGTVGTGTLSIHGNDSIVTGDSVTLGSGGNLKYFVESSVTSLDLSGDLTIINGANLIIDAANYEGTGETLTLATFDGINGIFTSTNVILQNFKGSLTGQVNQLANSITIDLSFESFTNNEFIGIGINALWSNDSHWTLGSSPSGAQNAIITGGSSVLLDSDLESEMQRVTVGDDSNTNTTLKIQSDLFAYDFLIATQDNSHGNVNQTGGIVRVPSTFQISSTNPTSSQGGYEITEGTLNFSGATLEVGRSGMGSFIITGDSAEVSGDSLHLGDTGSLKFNLGTQGVNPIVLDDSLVIETNAKLVIDGSNYRNGVADIVLATFANSSGAFDIANISITNLPLAFTGTIISNTNSLILKIDSGAITGYNIFSPAIGDWTTSMNWTKGNTPTGGEQAIINNGRVANLNSAKEVAVRRIIVGNSITTGTTLNIASDLYTNDLIIASASGSTGAVYQSAGNVRTPGTFNISSNTATSTSGLYSISGGNLNFSDTVLNVGTKGTGLFEVSTSNTQVAGTAIEIGASGTIQFTLDTSGVAPISLEEQLNIQATSKLVIDGTKYEGMNGVIPLILSGDISSEFTPSQVSFIGLDDRHPQIFYETDGIFLRLNFLSLFSDRLSSLIPESSIAVVNDGSSFTFTREYDPSNSPWSANRMSEAYVMDAALKHNAVNAAQDWAVRIGRGGQIYSLIKGGQELVPPQSSTTSAWNDEVWQGVSINTHLNDPSNNASYFIHQAGTYDLDTESPGTFYSPQLAYFANVDDRSYTTFNWGQHAHIRNYTDDRTDNDWQSNMIYISRVKDLGDGVIECTTGFYNYGPDLLNWFNTPWGGMRRTAMGYNFQSQSDGSVTQTTKLFSEQPNPNIDETGGWIAYSADENGEGSTMGLVYGKEATTPLPNQYADSFIRLGYAGGSPAPDETAWRNYTVTSLIRRYNLEQGNGVWSRFYFVMGDSLTEVQTKIDNRGLAENEEFMPFDITESNSPLVGYTFEIDANGIKVAQNDVAPLFYLYAQPVKGSFPLFEIIENDGTRHLTWDAYATGVIKTYDGTISSIRLLGFAIKTADEDASRSYESLDTLFANIGDNYIASGESLSARINLTDLERWRVENFGFIENNGKGANTQDSDNDNISNLEEYAFGGDPNINNRSILPALVKGENGDIVYRFFRRKSSTLDYELQTSNNLNVNSWQQYLTTETTNDVSLEFEEVHVDPPITDEPHRFLRLEISEYSTSLIDQK